MAQLNAELTTDMKSNPEWQPTLYDYEALFQSVPCYISVQDRDFKIIVTNELFQKDFGPGLGELCYSAYKRRDTPCPECPVAKTFKTGEVHSSEERIITADGRQAIVVVYTSPLRNEKGEIVNVMEMSTNITYIKELQTELTMMGQTIANMAHGIKNILTGLEGGIYMVDHGLKNKNEKEAFKGWKIIKRNVDRITTQVKDILYCAKKRDHEISMVKPNMVVKEVFELFNKIAGNNNVQLEMKIDKKLNGIPLNYEALHTILSNLVQNAVEACKFDSNKQKHKVVITSKRKGPLAILEVSDDGPGIPESWGNFLFTQVISTKDRYGTGIGLLITKKIVDELDGQITYSSSPDNGTTFHVSFPVK